MKKFFEKISLFYSSKWFLWSIICLGIILRLRQYVFNRPLWIDEAQLALDIINKSFTELLQSLSRGQDAPIGFLLTEKFLIQAFGSSEYILRLFPFICGIISLFVFYKVATYYIRRKCIPIALGLFAISYYLIYYSSEAKQYSSDVFIALLLYWIINYIQSKKLNALRIALLGVLGIEAIWFSYPSVFVLAGIGICLILSNIRKKARVEAAKFLISCSFWVLSFVIYYYVSLDALSKNKMLLGFWKGTFVPPFPLNFTQFRWLADSFFYIFRDPGGMELTGISALAFIIGCVAISSKSKKKFFLLISPAFFTLLASCLHKYPFALRHLLFLVPFIILFIAEGAGYIIDKTRHNFAIIGIIIIVFLFLHPLLTAGRDLINPNPFTLSDIRAVMSHIKEHRQSGDIIYVPWNSQFTFEYYAKNYGFNDDDYTVGWLMVHSPEWHISKFDELRGNKRVWILFTEYYRLKKDQVYIFKAYLDKIGTMLDVFYGRNAVVYLYDLSKK